MENHKHHCENEYLNQDELCRCDKQCINCELLEEKQQIMKYTQTEIDSSINKLTVMLDNLILERKGLNEQMRDIKKNIQFYEDLDCSQLKAF